jgi:hypothetical protein
MEREIAGRLGLVREEIGTDSNRGAAGVRIAAPHEIMEREIHGTIKHPFYENKKLLVIEKTLPTGAPTGDYSSPPTSAFWCSTKATARDRCSTRRTRRSAPSSSESSTTL